MEFETLERALLRALKNFSQYDDHLISAASSERSMTHSLAMQIGRLKFFKPFSIDC